MLGAGTLARMKEWMTSFPCETHEWDWDTEPCPDTDTVFKYKLFGKIAATLCDPDKLAAWIQELPPFPPNPKPHPILNHIDLPE